MRIRLLSLGLGLAIGGCSIIYDVDNLDPTSDAGDTFDAGDNLDATLDAPMRDANPQDERVLADVTPPRDTTGIPCELPDIGSLMYDGTELPTGISTEVLELNELPTMVFTPSSADDACSEMTLWERFPPQPPGGTDGTWYERTMGIEGGFRIPPTPLFDTKREFRICETAHDEHCTSPVLLDLPVNLWRSPGLPTSTTGDVGYDTPPIQIDNDGTLYFVGDPGGAGALQIYRWTGTASASQLITPMGVSEVTARLSADPPLLVTDEGAHIVSFDGMHWFVADPNDRRALQKVSGDVSRIDDVRAPATGGIVMVGATGGNQLIEYAGSVTDVGDSGSMGPVVEMITHNTFLAQQPSDIGLGSQIVATHTAGTPGPAGFVRLDGSGSQEDNREPPCQVDGRVFVSDSPPPMRRLAWVGCDGVMNVTVQPHRRS